MNKLWPLYAFWIAAVVAAGVPLIWLIEIVHYRGWAWALGTLLAYFASLGLMASLLEDNRRK